MSSPPLALVYQSYRSKLVVHVARCFPRLCAGAVEDAIESTFEAIMRHPELLERAWSEGGEVTALRLLRKIAWRSARATVCRGAGPREVFVSAWAEDALVAEPVQEQEAELRALLERSLAEAVSAISPKHAVAVLEAFRDRLATGDEDTVVARRHGIPREYLSRVRHELRRQHGSA